MTKKILITGKDSYIGRSFIEYCNKQNIDFEITELDVRGNEWKNHDFSVYDTIIHLAGIAHIKETKANEQLYYDVNRDLAIDIANKAKKNGIKHFIFMSTMSVYGLIEGYIDENTPTNPVNAYGKSKLEAELEINKLSNEKIVISTIRPPMIYGPNSKGNYSLLSNFAKKTKIFPEIENERSMLFIDNLSEFLIQLILQKESGLFFPQNQEYVSTTNMIKEIAKIHDNKIYYTNIFNELIKLAKVDLFKKVFGTLTYSHKLSGMPSNIKSISFEESIRRTESD